MSQKFALMPQHRYISDTMQLKRLRVRGLCLYVFSVCLVVIGYKVFLLFLRPTLYTGAVDGNMFLLTIHDIIGTDFNAPDHHGRSALHLASAAGKTKVVEFLLERGADVNIKDMYLGYTPLQYAAHEGRVQTARILVDHGANMDGTPLDPINTPLVLAIHNERLEVAQYLIGSGARYCIWDVVEMMLAFGNSIDPAELLGPLLQSGANVNAKNDAGDTALHLAVKHGLKDLVRQLLDAGADATIRDSSGETPLELAIESGSGDMISLFTDHAASSSGGGKRRLRSHPPTHSD